MASAFPSELPAMRHGGSAERVAPASSVVMIVTRMSRGAKTIGSDEPLFRTSVSRATPPLRSQERTSTKSPLAESLCSVYQPAANAVRVQAGLASNATAISRRRRPRLCPRRNIHVVAMRMGPKDVRAQNARNIGSKKMKVQASPIVHPSGRDDRADAENQ